MTPEGFLQLSDLLPEPMLLVTAGGTVVALNRATRERLGLPPIRDLAGAVTEPPDEVARYLRACSRSRQMVIGVLTVRGGVACRAEGAVVEPATDGTEALVLLRLVPKQSAAGQFVALNLRIDELGREVHRRKAAEEAVRRQEEWLRVTLTSIGDAVIATDPDGRVTFMNGVAEGLTGWPLADARGRPLPEVFNIVNEYTREPAENPALRALREGRVVGLANHTVLIARDGAERPIDDSASPMRDGRTVGAVLVFRDVTDRKQAEEAVRERDERLQLAVAIARMGTFEIDLATGAVAVNEPGRDIYGWADTRTTFTEVQTHFYPADRDRVMQQVGAALDPAGPGVFEVEQRIVRADGAVRWLRVRGRALFDGDGPARRAGTLIGAYLDVTERKEAEDAVRASEERLKRMVNVGGVGVLVWALPDGRMIGSNDYFLQMFGYSRSEVEAGTLTWRDLTPPEYIAASEEQLARFAETGRIGPYEKEYFRRDGSRAWMVFAGASLGDGTVVEYCIDVSDRKRAEDALRDADRKKDDFIALLAHELRNPLAPIRNGLQVIRLAKDAAARERAQAMMDRQLAHMVRMIDDLLDVSRIGRNKMDLRRARVTLAEVVGSAVETARPAIEEAGHELVVSLPPDPIHLDADLTRLSQVVSNLLTNSAKYTPKGGSIWLSAERAGGHVLVTVRDTGIGIPARALPTIFDMFSQVDRSVERTTGGLGIGLALVKGLVEMHGGTVTARSEGEGKGSEFTVALPALADRASAPEDSAAEPAVARARHRVLVVDDSRDGAESMAMMLDLMGNEVAVAHDGLDAIERAEQFRPDVILMDVGMPKLDGLEATRRIRERPWGRGVTIVALTGWGQDADRERTRAAGCDGHLVKPVNLPDLEKVLAELRPR